MPLPALSQPANRFTWSDYRSWPDDERWELIDGVAYAMSAAPSIKHQDVVGRLFSRIEQQLRGRPCRPFVAPTDVKLSASDVVQPDLLVVCDPAKITPGHRTVMCWPGRPSRRRRTQGVFPRLCVP